MKKLAASYDLSEDAKNALNEQSIQNAAHAPNESQALAAVSNVPSTVNTVEDATRIAGQLGKINKQLRAARQKRQ